MKINNIDLATRSKGSVSVPGTSGMMTISEDVIEFLNDRMKDKQTYLEIGTFDGVALAVMAKQNPGKQYYAIDAFKHGANTGCGCLGCFIDNNKQLSNVSLFIGTTETVDLPDVKFDVVFIDGDHSYEWVWKDFNKIFPLMNPGWLIVFHDYPMPGVKEAIDEICAKLNVKLNRHPSLVYIEA